MIVYWYHASTKATSYTTPLYQLKFFLTGTDFTLIFPITIFIHFITLCVNPIFISQMPFHLESPVDWIILRAPALHSLHRLQSQLKQAPLGILTAVVCTVLM